MLLELPPEFLLLFSDARLEESKFKTKGPSPRVSAISGIGGKRAAKFMLGSGDCDWSNVVPKLLRADRLRVIPPPLALFPVPKPSRANHSSLRLTRRAIARLRNTTISVASPTMNNAVTIPPMAPADKLWLWLIVVPVSSSVVLLSPPSRFPVSVAAPDENVATGTPLDDMDVTAKLADKVTGEGLDGLDGLDPTFASPRVSEVLVAVLVEMLVDLFASVSLVGSAWGEMLVGPTLLPPLLVPLLPVEEAPLGPPLPLLLLPPPLPLPPPSLLLSPLPGIGSGVGGRGAGVGASGTTGPLGGGGAGGGRNGPCSTFLASVLRFGRAWPANLRRDDICRPGCYCFRKVGPRECYGLK